MTNLDRESLRHAALEELYAVQPAARAARAIARRIADEVGFEFTPLELEASLEVLRDLKLADFHFDDLGSTKWWNITAEGVRKIERKS